MEEKELTEEELKWHETGIKIGNVLYKTIILTCKVLCAIFAVLFLFITKRKPPMGGMGI